MEEYIWRNSGESAEALMREPDPAYMNLYPERNRNGGQTTERREGEEENMEDVREMELYFNNGTSKPGFALSDDYTIQEIFEQLADQHVFDADKSMNEILLVNTRTNERYRYNDTRNLRDLGVQTGDMFQVMYDANVAGLSPAALQTRLRNEWVNLVEPMNRKGFIEITHSEHFDQFHVKVMAPSWIVGKKEGEEELAYVHEFTVYPGSDYPYKKPRVVFDQPSKRIKHINVWETGTICISDWSPKMCNIATTISKCIHAIAFDPGNWRKDSMACSDNLPFVEKLEAEHKVPTFDVAKIPLPGQKETETVVTKRRTFRALA